MKYRLYLIKEVGCHFCEKAEKVLYDYEQEHFGEGLFIRIPARSNRMPWKPSGVPAYFLSIGLGDQVLEFKKLGLMNATELARFIDTAKKKWEARFADE